MSTDSWNPSQYERFRNERSQPFFDLMAMVEPHPAMRVIDLGCGTGELTKLLHEHLHASETLGIDSSAAMLSKTETLAGDGLRFEQKDISDFTAGHHYHLVFSNAALHWTANHEEVLRRLTLALVEGGQLAVQVPANNDHPAHTVAAELAGESPFREAMNGYKREWPVLKPEEYAALLYRLGYREQQVRLQVYGHVLKSPEDVIEWVKGTLLTDYEKRMPADLYGEFLKQYRERLLATLEDTCPYFYPFKRILFRAKL
jgi:trans-aconitate 2-methyltransferase